MGLLTCIMNGRSAHTVVSTYAPAIAVWKARPEQHEARVVAHRGQHDRRGQFYKHEKRETVQTTPAAEKIDARTREVLSANTARVEREFESQ